MPQDDPRHPGPEVLRLDTARWSHPSLPVLIYRGAVEAGDPADVEARLAANGWRPDWRDGVYAFDHFHSNAHEALACTARFAELRLGGPEGSAVSLRAGDLLVLPAGTGHRRLSADRDFLVVGAYPDGRGWDVCREAADADDRARIAAVPTPSTDPLQGVDGPLVRLWRP